MHINFLLRTGFYFLVAAGLCTNAYSQRQTWAGLNVNGDVYPDNLRPSLGLTFEKQLKRHSGFETGLFYRTWKSSGTIIHTDSSGPTIYSFTVLQRHLTIPILYKYYSRILNFSAGPMVDFYVGWREINNGSPVHVTSFKINPSVMVGFLVKAGKIIPLNKRLLLEPEIRFGSVQTWDDLSFGIGIAGKYRF